MHPQRHFSPRDIEVVEEVDHDDFRLHQGQVLADTAPGACREGYKGVGLVREHAFVVPPFRVEPLGILVVLLVIHESQDVGADIKVGRQLIRPNAHLFPGQPIKHPHSRGPHPQALIHELPHVL